MLRRTCSLLLIVATIAVTLVPLTSQAQIETERNTLYDFPPRRLVDLPTAGTLPRGYFQLGLRLFANGGGLGYADIGLSNRFMMGISFGGEDVISDKEAKWQPTIEFSLKFRVIDELQYFPGVTVGFSSQGYGAYNDAQQRYAFKSRGFYAVASRSFYFHHWTAGWHFGMNYARSDFETENESVPNLRDIRDEDINFWAGFDVTFNYNLALLLEYDVALNDDRSENQFAGKGRGYLNLSVKWLFTENLEIEALARDLLLNRRESETFSREVRLTYIESF